MVTNEYPNWLVPLDAAKKLKDLGFNKSCIFSYSEGFGITACLRIGASNEPLISDFIIGGNTPNSPFTDLPTWEQVFEWFRERGYYGNLKATNKGTSAYIFYSELDNGEFWEFAYEETYEKARELLLLKLIDIYKTANQ